MPFANEANVKPGHTSTKWNPTWIESRFLVSIVYFHNSPKPRSRVQARRNISKNKWGQSRQSPRLGLIYYA